MMMFKFARFFVAPGPGPLAGPGAVGDVSHVTSRLGSAGAESSSRSRSEADFERFSPAPDSLRLGELSSSSSSWQLASLSHGELLLDAA
jgi:hypothetical protein